MKFNEQVDKQTADINLEKVNLTIDQDSVRMLMSTLTNLYSNSNESVIREYASNAIDSHIKAGIDTPIKVDVFPTRFVVQDYGVGMSKDDVINIYSRYGASTKRDNNKEIGGFGLGAKAALAITDRFDVISIKNGKRLKFYIEKDSKNIASVIFVSETDTQEPNGVKVTIPLSGGQFDSFQKIAEDFFRTWKPNTVILNGYILEPDLYNKSLYIPIMSSSNEPLAWVSKPSLDKPINLKQFDPLGLLRFVINGIIYEFSNEQILNYETLKDVFNNYRQLLAGCDNMDVLFNLAIGSVDLNPSREVLNFTEKTLSTIKTLLQDFIEQAPNQVAVYLNTLDQHEAIRFYFSRLSLISKGQSISLALTNPADYNITYKGNIIPNYIKINKKWYECNSIEGSALDKLTPISEIDLNNKNSESFYSGIKHILVKGDELIMGEKIRKNIRDYGKAKFETTNITFWFTNDTNMWIEGFVDEIVLPEDILRVAMEYRKGKHRVTVKTGVKKLANYVVIDPDSYRLTRIYQDNPLMSKPLVFLSENQHTLKTYDYRDFWKKVKTAKAEQNGKSFFFDAIPKAIKSLTEGYTVVLLPSGLSEEVFVKKYPNAINFEYIKHKALLSTGQEDKKIMHIIAKSRLDNSHTFFNSLGDEAKKIKNPLIRKIAIQMSNNTKLYGLSVLTISPYDAKPEFKLIDLYSFFSFMEYPFSPDYIKESHQKPLVAMINAVPVNV